MQETSVLLSPLLQILNEIKPVGNELQTALINNFRPEKFEKGKVLLQEGDVCKNLWFLSDGLLRSYHNIGEKEITSRIMFINHIVISPGSFFTQSPATESIEALADCIAVALPYSSLQDIYMKFPELNYHARFITEQYFYKQEQRLYMLRKQNSASKYKYFLENYSNYLKEIPQKYIASFLNITPETLSRIRSKFRKIQ